MSSFVWIVDTDNQPTCVNINAIRKITYRKDLVGDTIYWLHFGKNNIVAIKEKQFDLLCEVIGEIQDVILS